MAENQKLTSDVFQENSVDNQNVNKEADGVILNQNTNNDVSTSEEMLVKGKALMKDQQYEEAASILSEALQTIADKYVDNPKSIDLLEYYLNYGKALLRLTQNSNDVFGDSIRKTQKEIKEHDEKGNDENDEKGNDEDDENDEINENGENIVQCVDIEKQEANDKNEEIVMANDKNNNDDNSNPENSTEENTNEEAMDKEDTTEHKNDYDTTEDRELAWESLETSRVIINEFLEKTNPSHCEKELNEECKKYMLILAEIHSLLAESQMEDEIFEGALRDFEKALELRRACNDSWRELAYIHFMSSLCATYCRKNESSKQHLQDSIKLLRDRIIVLLRLSNVDVEHELENEKENESNSNSQNEKLLSFIETKLSMENINDETREEIKDLKQNLTELLTKMNEEENSKEAMNEDENGLFNQVIQSMLQGGNLNNETIPEENGDEERFVVQMEEDNVSSDNVPSDNVDDNEEDSDNVNDNEEDSDKKNNNDNRVDENENEKIIDNKENQHDITNKNVPYGVTTIGFSNDENDLAAKNEEKLNVNNLGNFGKGNSRKRNLEEAHIDDNSQCKKTRLVSDTLIDGSQ